MLSGPGHGVYRVYGTRARGAAEAVRTRVSVPRVCRDDEVTLGTGQVPRMQDKGRDQNCLHYIENYILYYYIDHSDNQ